RAAGEATAPGDSPRVSEPARIRLAQYPRIVDSARARSHSGVMGKPATVADLRQSGYTSRSVKQELRDNLIARLTRGQPLFSGIVGYEESVVPQIENAILSGQD